MISSFNPYIVLLSIFVAVYVSYIVVGVCLRIKTSRQKAAIVWTVGGAISMGVGIWAMHFIGMLAFRLPIPVYYDIGLTSLSILPAIMASAIALFMIRLRGQLFKFSVAALLMGLGISAMHYIGMAAMNMAPAIIYDSLTVALSVVIAIGASGSALFLLSYQIKHNQLNHSLKLLSALIMGLAITGMHYVGMFAASFPMGAMSHSAGGINIDRNVLLVMVTLVSFFILFITQLFTIMGKNISDKSFYEAVFNAHSNLGEGLLVVENEKTVLANSIFKALFQHSGEPIQNIGHLENSFSGTEYNRFIEWVTNHKDNAGVVLKQEFDLEHEQVKQTIEIALTSFIYMDKIRQLLVFNDITDKKRVEKSVKKLNETLELRVEKRTLELKKANVDLSQNMKILKDTQSELVHSQKMASLGSLVAGISHEINTPLGIGVTSASALGEDVTTIVRKFESDTMKKSDLEGFLNNTQESTTILMRNLKRASELISSFKQVAVDQSSDTKRKVNLHEYINEIILSMKPQLKRTQINISNTVPMDINTYMNPGVLYQVFVNLTQNSLIHGFSKQGCGDVLISGNLDHEHIKLNYRDNGIGISEEIQSKIFDPFFTTRMGEGGSGLGLNIVYNLIKTTLKGSIKVINDNKPGAHFEILLPIINNEAD